MFDVNNIASQALPFVILAVGMYLILIRPRQKEMKEVQNMLAALKAGDKVFTQGGFYGSVVEINGEIVILRLFDGSKIEVAKATLIKKVEA